MNVLPDLYSPSIGQTSPQTGMSELSAIRALRRAGDDMQERPQRPPAPQATREQQEDVMSRLDNRAEQDQGLSLKGKRAVAAYGALNEAEEQAYMKQVLGFDATI